MIGIDPSAAPTGIGAIEMDLLQLFGMVLMGLVSYAAKYVVDRLKLANGDAIVAAINDRADKAVTAGVMASFDIIKQNGWDHVETHNAITNAAVNYMADKFPDALKAAGVDLNTAAGRASVQDMIRRALPDVVARVSQSAATPDENLTAASTAAARAAQQPAAH